MLKYKIDIMQSLKNKGYTLSEFREKKILAQSTLTKLRNGIVVGPDNLNTLCMLLQCQPGDLLEYVPDKLDPAKKDGKE